MRKSTRTLSVVIRSLLLSTALLISTSLLGCKTAPVVISGDRVILFLNAGQVFTATNGGVYMSDALYQDYRRAVADKIQQAETAPAPKQ